MLALFIYLTIDKQMLPVLINTNTNIDCVCTSTPWD